MSQKRKRSPSPKAQNLDEVTVFRSSPIEDRESTFIALYSPSIAPKQLQSLAEIKTASHKILGWRRESNQQSLTSAKQYLSGHDDDGEKYAGKKVEQVLVNTGVTGACVVARWYGGVMLGPVRFSHMENCAREAVRQWQDHVAEEGLKKRRLEEEVVDKTRLVKVLAARDQSISVLRELALQKEATLRDSSAVTPTKSNGSSQTTAAQAPPTVDYAGMPVERLRSLEKARDATIGFLLKRIDKAEKQLESAEVPVAEDRPPDTNNQAS